MTLNDDAHDLSAPKWCSFRTLGLFDKPLVCCLIDKHTGPHEDADGATWSYEQNVPRFAVSAAGDACHDAATALQRILDEHAHHLPLTTGDLVTITARALDRFSRGES